MRIGIDFDNTIANYDQVFQKVAIKHNFVPKKWKGNKKDLKKFVIKRRGEELWKKIQGLVYGRYMQLAKVNQGFEKFLEISKILKTNIFIASHKTKFGHYDKKKILLRKVALNWIKNKNFYRKKNILKSNIFFEDTIEKKIKRINSLNLNFFIDDLSLILENKMLNKNIEKIHYFDKSKEYTNNRITKKKYWDEISDHIYDKTNLKNIKKISEFVAGTKIHKLIKLKGQKNSDIFRGENKKKNKFFFKFYPNNIDKRDRLKREIFSYQLLKKQKILNLPKLKFSNELLNIGAFNWIEGKKIIKPSQQDLIESINFIKRLKDIPIKTTNLFPYDAVEACKSLKDLTFQVNEKYQKLKKLRNSKNLDMFLNSKFLPIFKNLKKKRLQKYYRPINKDLEILSPSDFGFHNSLKDKENKVIFLDFEYFGKDDPVKLCSDFLLHPGMNLNEYQRKFWVKNIKNIFKNDKNFLDRLYTFIPFYALRWALIVLNDFKISDEIKFCKEKKITKKEFINIKKNQLKKAYLMCKLIKKKDYKKWFK